MLELSKGYYNIWFEKKNNIMQYIMSSNNNCIIFSEVLIDNKIYYSHNLKLLECYRGKHINIVEKDLLNKYKNIQFIFIHKTQNNINHNIKTIYIVYDDFNFVIDFKGVDYSINNYNNILNKKK